MGAGGIVHGIIFQKEAVFAIDGSIQFRCKEFDADDACGVMGKYVLKKSGKISRGNPFKNDLHRLLTSWNFLSEIQYGAFLRAFLLNSYLRSTSWSLAKTTPTCM